MASNAWYDIREKLEDLLLLLSRFLHHKILPISWIETIYTCAEHDETSYSKIHIHLSAWADEAANLLFQFSVIGCGDILHTVAAFSQEIKQLFRH